jgi:hypothetical protein
MSAMASNDPTILADNSKDVLRVFFTCHYDEIYAFAVDRNMTIDRWQNNTLMWALRFTPPQGGDADITIRPLVGGRCVVYANWFVDDYEAATRSFRNSESPEFSHDIRLRDALREALEEVLRWRKGDWSGVSGLLGAREYTREQWKNMQVRYPTVRPPGDAG